MKRVVWLAPLNAGAASLSALALNWLPWGPMVKKHVFPPLDAGRHWQTQTAFPAL
jgi:hypothetical protein